MDYSDYKVGDKVKVAEYFSRAINSLGNPCIPHQCIRIYDEPFEVVALTHKKKPGKVIDDIHYPKKVPALTLKGPNYIVNFIRNQMESFEKVGEKEITLMMGNIFPLSQKSGVFRLDEFE